MLRYVFYSTLCVSNSKCNVGKTRITVPLYMEFKLLSRGIKRIHLYVKYKKVKNKICMVTRKTTLPYTKKVERLYSAVKLNEINLCVFFVVCLKNKMHGVSLFNTHTSLFHYSASVLCSRLDYLEARMLLCLMIF